MFNYTVYVCSYVNILLFDLKSACLFNCFSRRQSVIIYNTKTKNGSHQTFYLPRIYFFLLKWNLNKYNWLHIF